MLLLARDEHATAGDRSSRVSGFLKARLYAGVGLVRDSRVREEMEEVDAKLLTAGRALGPWIRGARTTLAVESNAEESRAG